MNGASASAKKYATQMNGAAGMSEAYAAEQRALQQGINGTTKVASAAASKIMTLGATIGNILVFEAVIQGLSFVAKKANEFGNIVQETSNKAKGFTDSINSEFSSISGNITTLSKLNDEYQELSKGVDSLGRNLSLSNDEYDRYKTVISEISNIIPDLNGYFNSQGEMIGLASGKLLDLNEQYERYLQNKANDFFANGDSNGNTAQDILDDFSNAYNEYRPEKWYEKIFFNIARAGKYLGNVLPLKFYDYSVEDTPQDVIIQQLENFQNKSKEEIAKWLKDNGNFFEASMSPLTDEYELARYLSEQLGDPDEIANLTEEQFNSLQNRIGNLIIELQNDIDNKMNNVRAVLNAKLYQSKEYWAIDDSGIQDSIATFISSIDSSFAKSLELNTEADMTDFVYKVIDSMSNNEDIRNAWNNLFSPDLENLSVDEYIKKVNSYIDIIALRLNLTGDQKSEFINNLINQGISTKAIAESLIAVKRGLREIDKTVDASDLDKWLRSLSVHELNLVNSTDFKNAIANRKDALNGAALSVKDYTEELQIMLKAESMIPDSIDNLTEQTSGIAKSISKLEEALNGQSTGVSISLEDFTSEELLEYQSALEYVNGSMQLNAEKAREIAKAKAEEQFATNKTNKVLKQAQYIRNIHQIKLYNRELETNADLTDEDRESIQQQISSLKEQNNQYLAECNQIDLLNSTLRESISVYNEWKNAQNAAESGDMFDDALTAIKEIDDTLNDVESEIYGRVGRGDFKASLNFILPDTIDKDNQDAINSYVESIKKYLTFDDDGNINGLNLEQYIKDAVDKGLMVFDEASDSYKIAAGKMMKDFAESFNMSAALTQAIFGELQEFGGDFDWGDEVFKTLGDAIVETQKEADDLSDQLDELMQYRKLGYEVDDSQIKELEEELEKVNQKEKELITEAQVNIESNITIDDELDKVSASMSVIEERLKNDTLSENLRAKLQSDYQALETEYNSLLSQKEQLQEPTVVEIEAVISNLDDEIAKLEQEKAKYENDEWVASLKVEISDEERNAKIADLNKQITEKNQEKLQIEAYANIDSASSDLDKIGDKIDEVDEKEISNKEFDITADTKEADKALERIENYKLSDKKVTITTTEKRQSVVDKVIDAVTGNKSNKKKNSSKVSGTAKASGDWGNKNPGKTLVGELGREIIVNPHTGKWYTVGDNGAEFVNVPKNAIVFNNEQTEDLLSKGFVASRALALISGTALSSGTAMVSGGIKVSNVTKSSQRKGYNSYSTAKKKSSNSNSSNTSDNVASEETKQEIDWIERLLSKLQYRIDVTKSKLESLFSVKAKNANIDKQIKQTTSLLYAQTKAAESYQKYADAVNLSADLKKLVDSGNYNISEYSQDTADLINQYKDLRDKAKDARKAVYDLRAEIISLSQEKIDNITDSFSDKRDSYSARTDYLDERFDYETSNKKKSSILTAKAKLANKTYKTYKDEYITALKERKSDAKAAKRLIGQSGVSDKIKNTINSYIKNGKAIPDKYLNAVANAGDVSAYIKLVEYNQDLEWVDTSKYEAKKSKYETLNEIADSLQQKIDIVSESYSSKRDTYSSQSDYLDSKYNYETSNKKKSTILKEKTKNARKVYKTYKDEYSTALKERNADAKSAKKLLKKSGVSDKIKNAINSYIKKKKAIPQKYLKAVYNAGDIDAYTKLVEYNQDLKWVDTAKTEAKQAKYDYLTEKREEKAEDYENYANTYGAKSDYYKLLEDNATTGKQKNKYEKQSLNQTKKEYDMLIKAAKARGDNIEALRLEAELEQKINDSYKTMFDNMQKAYENKISLITNKLSDVDNSIKKVEAQGKRIDASFYGKKIKLEEQTLEKLQQEEVSLTKQVENVEKYSDEWYECQSAIQSVQDAEADALATIKEYRDAINEIADTINSDILSAFEEIEDEAEFLIKLLGDDLSDDDTGMLTEDGLAALALYKTQMDSSTESAKSLLSLIQSINSAIENGSYGSFLDSNGIRRQYASIDEAKDAVTDLYQTYRDEISKTYEYESDIIELVKKKYEAELNYLKDLIDKKKESLDAEKDLYDYAKNIRKQTENIDSLRKQINALRGDTSKEGQARIQKLESQLKDAQEELRDTEYDRYISDQKDMLDNLYNEYAELVAKLEKNREQLLKEGLDLFSSTSADVQDLIRETAESYGYQMTAQMSDISSALGTNSPIYSILTEIRDEVKNRYVNLSSASSTASETTTAQTNASSTSTASSSTSAIESLLRSGTHGYNPKNASALNTYIHDKYGTALTPAQMVTLAGYLGLNYSANDITSNSKDSASNNKKNEILKKLKAQGFSKGGVIKADDSLADVLGVRSSDAKDKVILKGEAGERVLTKLQNDYWEKWTNALPDLVNAMPTLQDIAKIPDTTSVQNNNSMTKVEYGEVNINLPNVMNYQDFAREAQKDPKFNKLINSMVDNQLTGNGRLRKFNVRF